MKKILVLSNPFLKKGKTLWKPTEAFKLMTHVDKYLKLKFDKYKKFVVVPRKEWVIYINNAPVAQLKSMSLTYLRK